MNRAVCDRESLLYLADLRANLRFNLLDKIDALMRSVAIEERSAKGGGLTTVKQREKAAQTGLGRRRYR